LEEIENLGAKDPIVEASHSSRQVGNGAKRPRPQATQLSAWRVGNKLQSKAKREQALLEEERPCVLGRNDIKVNTTSFFTIANGAPTTNRPLPLRLPPSLIIQAKPILKL
jgi:hypothetical protein